MSAQTLLTSPGEMVSLSPAFRPPVLSGVKVYANDPFHLDFILEKGDIPDLQSKALRQESTRLIKYFLASLTIPEKDLWVNLSPYEENRIVPEAFGQTEMGRDLLAQDYFLKQLTSSLMFPDGELGKKFWAEIYRQAREKFGSMDMPVDTFNKVWIVAEKAVIYENKDAAYVAESRLKVMLDSDYMAMTHAKPYSAQSTEIDSNILAKDVIRQIILPALDKEVNEGKGFAQLRQVYNALILATWYKGKIKESLLSKAYVDKKKVVGVNIDDAQESEKIWAQYVLAFKKGVYNLIKEEKDTVTQEIVPRKYFSGGVMVAPHLTKKDPADMMMAPPNAVVVSVDFGMATSGQDHSISDFWAGAWSRVPDRFRDGRGWYGAANYPQGPYKFIMDNLDQVMLRGRDKVRAVDLGSGANLFLARVLAKYFSDKKVNAEIHALDPAKESDVTRLSTNKNIIYHSGRLEDGDGIEAGSMDIVVSSFVLDYTDMRASLKQINRMLARDGRAILVLHHPASSAMKHVKYYAAATKNIQKILEHLLTSLNAGRDLDSERLLEMGEFVYKYTNYQAHITELFQKYSVYLGMDIAEQEKHKENVRESILKAIQVTQGEISSQERLLSNLFRNKDEIESFLQEQGYVGRVSELTSRVDYDGSGYQEVVQGYGIVLQPYSASKMKDSLGNPDAAVFESQQMTYNSLIRMLDDRQPEILFDADANEQDFVDICGGKMLKNLTLFNMKSNEYSKGFKDVLMHLADNIFPEVRNHGNTLVHLKISRYPHARNEGRSIWKITISQPFVDQNSWETVKINEAGFKGDSLWPETKGPAYLTDDLKRKLGGAAIGRGTGMRKLGEWMLQYPTTMVMNRFMKSAYAVEIEIYTEIPDKVESVKTGSQRGIDNGGIDLTADRVVVQVKTVGESVRFKFDLKMFQRLQAAPGLMPMIIKITPMVDLKVFLSLKDLEEKDT